MFQHLHNRNRTGINTETSSDSRTDKNKIVEAELDVEANFEGGIDLSEIK
jgi:hypothetical protein